MKLIKRLTALLLAAVLVTGLFPFPASAQEQEPLTFETTYINPLYADIVSEEDIPPIFTPKAQTYETVHYVTTAEDAGIILREHMKARMEAPVVHIFANISTSEEFSALCNDIYEVAKAHTQEPNEGDYILWHLSGYEAKGKLYSAEGGYNIDITYSMVYHSNDEQEAAVDAMQKYQAKAAKATTEAETLMKTAAREMEKRSGQLSEKFSCALSEQQKKLGKWMLRCLLISLIPSVLQVILLLTQLI